MNVESSRLSWPKNKIEIVLLEGIHQRAIEAFKKETFQVRTNPGKLKGTELETALGRCHVVGIRSGTPLSRKVLEVSPRLLAIGCFCIGTDQVDLKAAMHLGIPVFNAPYENTRSVAELVVAEIVMLLRRTFEFSTKVHEGKWPKTAERAYEIRGKTLGIIGYGHIGAQVSVLAEAMGLKVLFHDIADVLPMGNAKRTSGLGELLTRSDIITLHVPADASTRDMIGPEEIAKMRKGSYLINASRGSVVVIDALAAALKNGHLGGAAIDVYPKEPTGPDKPLKSPLRGLPNVILTPHIGGSTTEAQESIARDVSKKLIRYINNGSTIGAVNFPEVDLPIQGDFHRILHIHRNVPGVLSAVNGVMSKAGINIQSQYLRTRSDIGYLVMDINRTTTDNLLRSLRELPQTIRVRALF